MATAQAVYIILDGEFIVNKQAENGKQVGLTFCYRGEFLGEMEAICRQAYRYDVIALSDCRVLRMPAATFLSGCHRITACLCCLTASWQSAVLSTVNSG